MAQREAVVRSYRPIEELIPAHWTQETVVANGIHQRYYRTGGDKPPLVLLHGFLEGAICWLRAARALERDYDVILVDARGHGGSERVADGGFTQELLAEDVGAFLQALGLSRVRLLGFSQGATTAIRVAARHPELISALIVAGWSDSAPSVDFTQSEGYKSWLDSYAAWLAQLKTLTHEERMVAALSQLQPGAPLLPEDEYVPWVEACAALDLDLVQLGMGMWAGLGDRVRETVEALGRVTCPVLLVQSEFFPAPGAPRRLVVVPSDRPNVTAVRFENTGHLIYRERFAEFIGVVGAFLAGEDVAARIAEMEGQHVVADAEQ